MSEPTPKPRESLRFTHMLWQSYGAWPTLDHVAHKLHIRGPIGRFLCRKADRAYGRIEDESAE